MESRSAQKLLKSGYILLRTAEDGGYDSTNPKPKIKYSDTFGSWHTLAIFDTKAARKRRLDELMEQDKYLLDQ